MCDIDACDSSQPSGVRGCGPPIEVSKLGSQRLILRLKVDIV